MQALAPYPNALAMIGDTPMVEVTRIDTGPCRLFLKLENQNPGGSIKDRVALSMIEAAEQDGRLQPGGTIVEATAGNTGLGLAQVSAVKGYRLVLIVPDKMSREKVAHLRALGAEVRWTRSDVGKGHPEYYQDMAAALAATLPDAIYINQFENPANPKAHETTTAPEIFAQLDGDVDAVVVGVGSGGTLTGIGRFMAARSPKTQMVLADPKGSILTHYVETGELVEAGSWAIEGIGEDFIPDNAEMDYVKRAFTIDDRESIETARLLLRQEGLLGGSSTGTLVAAALRYCREQTEPKRVVTFVCDRGDKYLNKVFNDFWVEAQGLADRPLHGDLSDLVSRRPAEGAVVSVAPDDTLLTAYKRMRDADVSQLPVLDPDGRIAGVLDESDVLSAVEGVSDREHRFAAPVRSAMTAGVHTLPVSAPLEALRPVFDAGQVAVVTDASGGFAGLITRADLLNHLRLRG